MEDCTLGIDPIDQPMLYRMNHEWEYAKKAARKRDRDKCVKCGSTSRLEVNHIVPRGGRGYDPGCVHHVEVLETLCQPCHVGVTADQRMEARLGPDGKPRIKVDSRKRLSLGPWKSPYTNLYVVDQQEGGVIRLTPAVIVTEPEVVRGS